jgi:hypothetical protein
LLLKQSAHLLPRKVLLPLPLPLRLLLPPRLPLLPLPQDKLPLLPELLLMRLVLSTHSCLVLMAPCLV